MNHIIRKIQLKKYKKDHPELTSQLESLVKTHGKSKIKLLLGLVSDKVRSDETYS